MSDSVRTKEEGLEAARRFKEGGEEIIRERKRFRSKQIWGRLIFIPLVFIFVNGSFFLIFWVVGGWKLLGYLKSINDFWFYVGIFGMTAFYLGFIFLCAKPLSKLVDWLKMPWLLDD